MFKNTIEAIRNFYNEFGQSVTGSILVTILAVFVLALGITGMVAAIMSVWWLMWQFWMLIIPQIAGSMPQGFKYPDYPTFVGCWGLLLWSRMFIRNAFKPFKKDK